MDQHKVRFQQTMDDLNGMMEAKSLSTDLRLRLREYFQKVRDLNNQRASTELLFAMSPGLMGEVAFETNQEWLLKVWWLKPLVLGTEQIFPQKNFILDISQRLRISVYPP